MRPRSSPARAAAPAAALLLAGCVVGPHYRTPSIEPVTPAGFAEASGATSAQPPPGRWWRLYNDPALDALVQKALVRNTDLRQAAASLEEARGVLDEARAGLFPSTGVAAGLTRGRSSTVSGSASSAASTTAGGGGGTVSSTGNASGTSAAGATGTGTTGSTGSTGTSTTGTGSTGVSRPRAQTIYSLAASASYEVDLFGRIRRGIDAARADVESRAAAVDLARTAVAAETTLAYLGACTAAEEADIARRSLELVSDNFDIIVRQRDLGSASDYDVANVRTLLEQTRSTVAPIEASRRSSLYALAVLTGDPPESVSKEAAACRKAPQLVDPVPVGDGRGLLARRPDVRQAERTLAASVHRIDVATSELYPNVTLGASVATAATSLGGLGSRTGTSFSLGPLITWNFPNLIAARARVREANAEAQGALAAFDAAVLLALQDVEQALAVYGSELDRHAALQAAYAAAGEANRLAGVRAQAGSISFLDQLTVERQLVAAQADLAASDTALAADQVAVFRALGGGWEEAPEIDWKRPIPAKGAAAPAPAPVK